MFSCKDAGLKAKLGGSIMENQNSMRDQQWEPWTRPPDKQPSHRVELEWKRVGPERVHSIMIAGCPILGHPDSAERYPNFLAWWLDVGRQNPTDPQGWGSLCGPGAKRGRVEAIPHGDWAALSEGQWELIKAWTATLPITFFD